MIYLDYASSTPISQGVLSSMMPFLRDNKFYYANSNSSHTIGKKLSNFIEESRIHVLKLINGYSPAEIIFTSGATESNNIAILGSTLYSQNKDKKHIITTQIEHVSVLKCFNFLEKKGYKVDYLSVDKNGLINIDELKTLINKKTLLISIMHVNNEMGSVQNLCEISKILKNKNIIFHVDAAQSIGKINIDLQKLNIDLLSLSGHKIYGPKGIGVLFTRMFPKKVDIYPIMFGSSNERNLRPGTPFLSQIVGLGKACEEALLYKDDYHYHIKDLKNFFFKNIENNNNIILNGDINNIIPGIINVQVKYQKKLQLEKLQKEYFFSFGSSCSKNNESHVLKAMQISTEEIKSSIRLSFGIKTKKRDLLSLINKIEYICKQ